MAQFLASTTSLTSLFLSTHSSIAHDSRTLERLAEAFRMNETLECLTLFQLSNDEMQMDSFLLPLASHPTLRLLCMCFAEPQLVIPRALVRLLHSRSVRLGCLCLDNMLVSSSSNWNLLCDALKGNLSIRVLRFLSCSIAVPLSSILKLVRENGGIHAVSDDGMLSELNHPKVLAYCQRNVQLPVLLAEAFVHGRTGSVDGAGSSLSLLPTLLAAAQQAPRPAPNLILLALLAIPSDDIGMRPTDK
jgi:hypothetical protein